MRSKALWAVVAVCLLAAGGVYYAHKAQADSQPQPVVQVQWLVAHEPVSLFDRAQNTFVQVFNANSDGMRISVTGLGPSDFAAKGAGRLDTSKVFNLLDTNTVQIASVPVASMRTRDPQLGVLMLPYVFSNYDKAQTFLNGPIAQQLLDTFAASTTNHALAFTFSGGLEVIQTAGKKIQSPGDLKGLTIGTPNGPVSEDILRAMGATPITLDPQSDDIQLQSELKSGKVDGLEYTYTRLSFATSSATKSMINETDHSLFLTSIIVNDSFYNSLSPKNRAALQKAATAAAQVERADSIALGSTTKAALITNGDTIVTPTSEQLQAFKAATAGVMAKYAPVFGSSLINSILNTQQ